MTQEQPEALRLADQVADMTSAYSTPSIGRAVLNGAAIELRRLHARVQDLQAWQDEVRANSPLLARLEHAEAHVKELEAQLAAQRVPLTDERVSLMAHNDDPGDWNDLNFRAAWHKGYLAGARAIERAHGIGEQPCT